MEKHLQIKKDKAIHLTINNFYLKWLKKYFSVKVPPYHIALCNEKLCVSIVESFASEGSCILVQFKIGY